MSATASPIPVVVIGDHGGDPGDEYLLVVLAAYQRLGLVDLRAVVASGRPSPARAALAQGTCRQLGLRGTGRCRADNIGPVHDPAVFDAPYAQPAARSDGRGLLVETLRSAEPSSVRLVLTSAHSDADWLLFSEPELCDDRITEVTMMSGARFDEQRRQWVPDRAITNTADMAAAQRLFATLQQPRLRHVKVRVVDALVGLPWRQNPARVSDRTRRQRPSSRRVAA